MSLHVSCHMQGGPLSKTTVKSFLSPFLLCTALKYKWLLWIVSRIQNNQRTPLCLLQIDKIHRKVGFANVFHSDLVRKRTLRTFDSKYKLDHTKLQEPGPKTSALTTYIDSANVFLFCFLHPSARSVESRSRTMYKQILDTTGRYLLI